MQPDPESVKLAVFGVLGMLLLTVFFIEASKAAPAKWKSLWLMNASLTAFGQVIMFGWFYLLVMK